MKIKGNKENKRNKRKLLKVDELSLDKSISRFIKEKLRHSNKYSLEELDKNELISLVEQLTTDHHKACIERELWLRLLSSKDHIND